ncbi:MAG: tRNA uridine-5-carboxymethylaminomethyl(34) synthesis GTPase MnmE [Pelotomaculum sp.]|nr:tRNA uridine-5-carboxymethylaminomethyl(34) synthesis GTPase MnmE [Pelotomaculum sp.]
MLDDTIAAISTPIGEGGIGIVRISGPDAVKVAKKFFLTKRKDWDQAGSHRLIYGHVFDREGNIVDEVLLSFMRAPRTYTREDVVEINCHGGIVPLRKVLELALANGARLAEPGEFSKRAFLNGRLDLAQAESVIDIIRSKTEAGLRVAVSQLRGDLSRKVEDLQGRLLGLLAQVEANIDFPEDDLEEATVEDILRSGEDLIEEIKEIVRRAEAGKIYREGISTVIIGRPNVGKSSLLNALLRENRAIVTDIPGTTRDIIEEYINIRGIPLKIIDTAGLRETGDAVERIGVEKAREAVEQADLVLLVLDAARGLTEEDYAIIEKVGGKKVIFIVNKADVREKKISSEGAAKIAGGRPVLWISALEGTGLDKLEEKIVEMVMGGQVYPKDELIISNTRHRMAMERAADHLAEAVSGIRQNVPVDVVAIDLRAAWESLGEITGTTVTEDLIDRIFADFCIGK